MIKVKQTTEEDPLSFVVTVEEGSDQSTYQVTMSQASYQRLTEGQVKASECIRAAFKFLLEREPREAILKRFDITLISHYFPDFEQKLPRYLESL